MKFESFAALTAQEFEHVKQKLGQFAALDPEGFKRLVEQVHSKFFLEVLMQRGGHPGAVAEAVLLSVQKGIDYNQGAGAEAAVYDPHAVRQDAHFPLGLASYAQMLHVKSYRLISLCRRGAPPTNESCRDTALDIINYAGFLADWLWRNGGKGVAR